MKLILTRRRGGRGGVFLKTMERRLTDLGSEGGTAILAVTVSGHRLEACATLVSTDGKRLSQRSPPGDFQRRVSSQTILS
jgi:hypothetical protein